MNTRTNVQDRSVEVEGLRIRYLTAGEVDPPVLLLHGGGLDSASLSYRFSVIPISQHHRVFAPDWPGYGKSDEPRIESSTEYYINVLGHLMDTLSLARASLVGLSMGGGIALGFALQSPQRVEKLVLVDSYGLGREIPGRAMSMSYMLVRLPLLADITWVSLGWSRWTLRRSLKSIVHNPQAVTEELIDEVYQLLKKPGARNAFTSWLRSEVLWSGLRTDYVGKLHEVTVPTLILHGAEDRLVPVSWAQRAHTLIKGSELHIFPECGHWPPREKTDEFNSVVLSFLAKR